MKRYAKIVSMLMLLGILVGYGCSGGNTKKVEQDVHEHEHEEHGDEHDHGTEIADPFEIPKNTQFLLGIETEEIGYAQFTGAKKLNALVEPVNNGLVEVAAPFNSQVVTVAVNPGQKVRKGQLLVSLEKNVGPLEQFAFEDEYQSLLAAYNQAKKDVERLEKVSDIVAGKELEKARIRLAEMEQRKVAHEAMHGKTHRAVKQFFSPTDGWVNNFTLSVGQVVAEGAALITISNNANVKLAARVYQQDIPFVERAGGFEIQKMSGEVFPKEKVRFVGIDKRMDSQLQASKAILEVENDGSLRPGQYVKVYVLDTVKAMENVLFVPNRSITEVSGVPVVFVHTGPEEFQAHYVKLGESSATHTRVLAGLGKGERVVTKGTYQVKSIYLSN